jgi:hypothetical protein
MSHLRQQDQWKKSAGAEWFRPSGSRSPDIFSPDHDETFHLLHMLVIHAKAYEETRNVVHLYKQGPDEPGRRTNSELPK